MGQRRQKTIKKNTPQMRFAFGTDLVEFDEVSDVRDVVRERELCSLRELGRRDPVLEPLDLAEERLQCFISTALRV